MTDPVPRTPAPRHSTPRSPPTRGWGVAHAHTLACTPRPACAPRVRGRPPRRDPDPPVHCGTQARTGGAARPRARVGKGARGALTSAPRPAPGALFFGAPRPGRPGAPPRALHAPHPRAVRPGPGCCRAPPALRATPRGGVGVGPVLLTACRRRGRNTAGTGRLRSQGCAVQRRASRRSVLSAAAGLRVHWVRGAPDPIVRSAVPGQLARARDAASAGCQLAARRMEGRTPPDPVLTPRKPTFSTREGSLR